MQGERAIAQTAIDLGTWDVDPFILLGLALTSGLYALGWQRLRARARRESNLADWRRWAFLGGIAALVVALLSPVATLDGVLFSAHMLQHLLLIQLAAPLLLLGAPVLPLLWGLPGQERRGAARLFFSPRSVLNRVGHVLTEPALAATLFLVSVTVWHVPALYDAAQGRTATHVLEHLLFLGTALLYWWPVVHPSGGRRRLGLGSSIFYLLPPLVGSNLLGALLTFARTPLYRTYVEAPRVTSLSALDDQQLGGLLMWVVGGMAWGIAVFIALGVFLRREQEAAEKSESVWAARHR